MQIWNSAQSSYSTNLSSSVTTSALQLRTHSTDSTLTTFGAISGGDGYIQRSNGPGTGSYNLRLNPYGGAVLMPQQPAFCATSSGGYQTAASMPFTSTKVNVNSCFSTSTYRFTAPVAGRYFFTCHVYFDNNTTADGYPRFKLNGATNHGYAYMQGNSDGDKTLAMSTILDLSANDYVQLVYTGTLNYYGGVEETQFMGFLIG
jgi:hypothetical protein